MRVTPRAVSKTSMAVAVCGGAMLAMTISGMAQQANPQTPQAPQAQGGRGGGRGGASPALFNAADTNKDGSVTRTEFKGSFETWFTQWDAAGTGSLTQDQVLAGLTALLQPAGGGRGAAAGQNQTPNPTDVQAMMAALPAKAPATP